MKSCPQLKRGRPNGHVIFIFSDYLWPWENKILVVIIVKDFYAELGCQFGHCNERDINVLEKVDK